jgi:hypothetical protein
MPPPAAPVAQEPRQGEHHRARKSPAKERDEQMGEISMIFGGSMFIASKTQGKKLKWEISLA